MSLIGGFLFTAVTAPPRGAIPTMLAPVMVVDVVSGALKVPSGCQTRCKETVGGKHLDLMRRSKSRMVPSSEQVRKLDGSSGNVSI